MYLLLFTVLGIADLALLSILILDYRPARSKHRHTTYVLVLGCLLYVTFVLVAYGYTTSRFPGPVFAGYANSWFKAITFDPSATSEVSTSIVNDHYYVITNYITNKSGSVLLASLLVDTIALTVAVYYTYRLAEKYLGKRLARRAALLFALMPLTIFSTYQVSPHLVSAAILVSFVYYLEQGIAFGPIHFTKAFVAGGTLLLFRPTMAVGLPFIAGVCLIHDWLRRHDGIPIPTAREIGRLVLLVGIPLASFIWIIYATNPLGIQELGFEAWLRRYVGIIASQEKESGMAVTVLGLPPGARMIAGVPLTFLMPFPPWKGLVVGNVLMAVITLEVFVYLILLGGSLIGMRRVLGQGRGISLAWTVILFVLGLGLVYGGLKGVYRLQIAPYIIILYFIGVQESGAVRKLALTLYLAYGMGVGGYLGMFGLGM